MARQLSAELPMALGPTRREYCAELSGKPRLQQAAAAVDARLSSPSSGFKIPGAAFAASNYGLLQLLWKGVPWP